MLWKFIHNRLAEQKPVMLLCVLDSEGSSPGRQGFKMAVDVNGEICQTIGGGMMEHKLVEKAKDLLAKQATAAIFLPQYHSKTEAHRQSGMICSGHQFVGFIPLFEADQSKIVNITNALNQQSAILIKLSKNGLVVLESDYDKKVNLGLEFTNDEDWIYTEMLGQQPKMHIIGGGHVGLELSRIMHYLGFAVEIYDDRPNLNTLEQNEFVAQKHLVDYANFGEYFQASQNDYVAIMTFGYRSDKVVLKQVLDKQFYYIGMLGSQKKIDTLLAEMLEEGHKSEEWKHVKTPIGLSIHSKTAQEIAISIAAEIIQEKNKDKPSGREKSSE